MMSNVINFNKNDSINNQLIGLTYQYLKYNKSQATYNKYKTIIEDFFGVPIDFLSYDNVVKIHPLDAMKFFNDKIENGEEKSTVSAKVSAVKGLYDFLMNNLLEEKNGKWTKLIEINPLAEYSIAYDTTHYGTFTEDDVRDIIKCARDNDDIETAIYYETILISAIRPEAVLKLNIKENFRKINGVWNIVTLDKGKNGLKKEATAEIEDYLYNDLKMLADRNDGGKIFTKTRQTYLDKLKSASNRPYKNCYCAKIGISEEECKARNLVLHSFKRTSICEALKLTNNIMDVKNHAHHANISTTNVYLTDYNDGTKAISRRLNFRGKSHNEDALDFENIIKGMSKDELVELILKNKNNITL